jgi:hypothetical protein
MGGDRRATAVIERQVDNIHRELERLTHRMAQLETIMFEVIDTLREMAGLPNWLEDDGAGRPTSGPRFPRKGFH